MKMNRERSQETFTLFIDNIPEHKDQFWLKRAFNKFGEVKDAFIPRKRSKRTGNKFGFVRFGCSAAASMAISRMNGIWVENERLFVKEASFGINAEKSRVKQTQHPSLQMNGHSQGAFPVKRLGKDVCLENNRTELHGRSVGITKSFAHVLKGESSRARDDLSCVLNINPCSNGWLHRSAVAVMHRPVSMMTLKVSFSLETDRGALFRSLGGRAVLITFQNQVVRDEMIQKQWMKLWFASVKPWRGEPACLKRFVWLSCKGVPLNIWNAETFKVIAEMWGSFILLDMATLKDLSFAEGKVLIATEKMNTIDKWIQIVVQGASYDVKISETSSFVNPEDVEALFSQAKIHGGGNGELVGKPRHSGFSREKGEDDDVAIIEVPNKASVVGDGWDPTSGKVDGGGGGSKHGVAGEHLMLDGACSPDSSKAFESRVEDTVETPEKGEADLGLMAHSNLLSKEAYLAQEGVVDLECDDGPHDNIYSEKAVGDLLVGGPAFTSVGGNDY
ncbi:hypothetical protein RHMOL_Rhmol12G0140800 [Rhododendron molle]|uniref:Uncharacterized protein n=1 Tax=Rhododendron molle TaxID=49168 RepID=A0ACC0LIV6_RHOML|nr:hypothetical protein RHMOL_Rhmol12G0140800 [Rhododendron molle]